MPRQNLSCHCAGKWTVYMLFFFCAMPVCRQLRPKFRLATLVPRNVGGEFVVAAVLARGGSAFFCVVGSGGLLFGSCGRRGKAADFRTHQSQRGPVTDTRLGTHGFCHTDIGTIVCGGVSVTAGLVAATAAGGEKRFLLFFFCIVFSLRPVLIDWPTARLFVLPSHIC